MRRVVRGRVKMVALLVTTATVRVVKVRVAGRRTSTACGARAVVDDGRLLAAEIAGGRGRYSGGCGS